MISKFLKSMFSWVLSFGVLIAIALWIFMPYVATYSPETADFFLHEKVETLADNPDAYTEAYFSSDGGDEYSNNLGSAIMSVIDNVDAPYNYGYLQHADDSTAVYGSLYSCSKEELDAFIQETEDLHAESGSFMRMADNTEELEANLRVALRIFGSWNNKLVSSNGVRFEGTVENPVHKGNVNCPFPEADEKQIKASGFTPEEFEEYNGDFTDYYPCLNAGLISEKSGKAFRNAGFRLKYKNIKVDKVMFFRENSVYNLFGVVSADVRCVNCPEELRGNEWIPAEGETSHVTFLVGSDTQFVLTYIDVIDFSPVESKPVIDVTKDE